MDCDVISSEKNTTDFFCQMAAFNRRLRENAVLPIEGLAAKMINSPGLNQEVTLSRLGYHDIVFACSISSG